MIPHARARFNQTAEVLAQSADSRIPVDAFIDQYFRANRKMGSKDRAFLAETIYGCLRRRRELQALYEPLTGRVTDTAPWLIATYLLKYGGWSGRALAEAGFSGDTDVLAARVRTANSALFPFAVRANLPDWLTERLLAQFGEDETLKLADALNRPATVDIRVNTLKTSRDGLQAQLREEGYELTPTPYSPFGLRHGKRGPLFNSRAFEEGLFELQDEGSQLIAVLVDAKPKEKIVDFCAGAGGKSLHIAAMMQNKGSIYACDVATRRLERLKPRLKRAGVDIIQRLLVRDEWDEQMKPLYGKMDAVLVDAPCSGTGTLRRNPDIKWKDIDLDKLRVTQQRILAAAARLVKPGGRLVYATCSLLDEENSAVTAALLAAHPGFKTIPAGEVLARAGITIADACNAGGALRLLPHRHGTDGFYALTMQRLAP